MSNIKRFSRFAAAGVLALTTAVYAPIATSNRASATDICGYSIEDTAYTISGSDCTVSASTLVSAGATSITITGSGVTLDLAGADIDAVPVYMAGSGTLTITGSSSGGDGAIYASDGATIVIDAAAFTTDEFHIASGATLTTAQSATTYYTAEDGATINISGTATAYPRSNYGTYSIENGAQFKSTGSLSADDLAEIITSAQDIYDDSDNSGNYIVDAKLTAANVTVSDFEVEEGDTLTVDTTVRGDEANADIASLLDFYDSIAIELTDTDASDYATVEDNGNTVNGLKAAADLSAEVTFTKGDYSFTVDTAKLTVTSTLGSVDVRFNAGGDATLNGALSGKLNTTTKTPTLYLDSTDTTRAEVTVTAYPRVGSTNTQYNVSDVEWTLESSDDNIATVSGTVTNGTNNNVLTISAVSAGTATITATAKTADGTEKSAQFAVNIYNVLDSLTQKEAITIVNGTTFSGDFADYFNESGLNATFEVSGITDTASESYLQIDGTSVKGIGLTGTNTARVTITATETNTGATATGILEVNVVPALDTIELTDVANTAIDADYDLELAAGETYDVLDNITLKDSEDDILDVTSVELATIATTDIAVDGSIINTETEDLSGVAQEITATVTYTDNAGDTQTQDITIKVTVTDEFKSVEIADVEVTAGSTNTISDVVTLYSANTVIAGYTFVLDDNTVLDSVSIDDEGNLLVDASSAEVEEATDEIVTVFAADAEGTIKSATFTITINPATNNDDNGGDNGGDNGDDNGDDNKGDDNGDNNGDNTGDEENNNSSDEWTEEDYYNWYNEFSSWYFLDNTNYQTITAGSAITFRLDEDYAYFVGVAVDGEMIDASNYSSWSGSTVVTLSGAYTKTLAQGDHTIEFFFDHYGAWSYIGHFTVNGYATAPNTGVNTAAAETSVASSTLAATAAITAGAAAVIYSRKKAARK